MSKGNPIPTRTRTLVKQRDQGHCVRCFMNGNQVHHRRGRSVSDEHQHCVCVCVTMCAVCHAWVHANPSLAMKEGWLVLRSETKPWAVPMNWFGDYAFLLCTGNASPAPSMQLLEEVNRSGDHD